MSVAIALNRFVLPLVLAAFCGPCAVAAAPGTATEPQTPSKEEPEFVAAFRGTADVWRNAKGGLSPGDTFLSKAQVSATWIARRLGDPDLRVHVQVFRTNGQHLTSRLGDVQTASNIEALSVTRLFEAWAEQSLGPPNAGGVTVRAGLIDLNSEFDSIDPAALFINSSHGIAPELSKSGRNGPSIFPVSAPALRLAWTPDAVWTVRGGLFDGTPGDLSHPQAFVSVRVNESDGALGIVQVDRTLGDKAQVSMGAWRYSYRLPGLDGGRSRRDGGVYAFVSGALPGLDGVQGWVRAGRAEPDVQVVAGYLGAGLLKEEPINGRKDDRAGLAFARAFISPSARRAFGLNSAETTIEATYQWQVNRAVALQPDVQYVIHPSTRAGVPNALALGLRLVVAAGFPHGARRGSANDPSVAPDTR